MPNIVNVGWRASRKFHSVHRQAWALCWRRRRHGSCRGSCPAMPVTTTIVKPSREFSPYQKLSRTSSLAPLPPQRWNISSLATYTVLECRWWLGMIRAFSCLGFCHKHIDAGKAVNGWAWSRHVALALAYAGHLDTPDQSFHFDITHDPFPRGKFQIQVQQNETDRWMDLDPQHCATAQSTSTLCIVH
jgi:hypothetical protein